MTWPKYFRDGQPGCPKCLRINHPLSGEGLCWECWSDWIRSTGEVRTVDISQGNLPLGTSFARTVVSA